MTISSPDASSRVGATASSETIRLLGLLARSRSWAEAMPDAAGGMAVHVLRQDCPRPLACFASAVWHEAVTAGWVAVESSGRHWRLSAAGRALIRRRLCQAGAPAEHPASQPCPSLRRPEQPGHNPAESPIAWLAKRRGRDGRPLICEAQFDAGERLRTDFSLAHMAPRVTADWSGAASGRLGRRGVPGAGVDIQDHVVAAKERVNRALAAVGPELSGILVDVCCHLKGLEDAERLAGWPQRSGKIVLQLALTRLARHYGIKAAGEREQPGAVKVRHWGTDDYRPTLDGLDTYE